MLPALLSIMSQPPAFIADLDRMAQARDVAGVHGYYGAEVLKLAANPMSVLKTGGAYGTGRWGWHALELRPPGETKSYAVFSTPLTLEDIGERLFEVGDDKLARYVDELESGGWSIASHKFRISFKLPTKEAFLKDTILLKHQGVEKTEIFIRFSPTYRIASIKDENTGKAVAFAQAGGIVALGADASPMRKLTLTYSGVVNLPNYGGIITNRYAMLTDEYWYPTIARQPAPYVATVEVPKGWSVVAQGERIAHDIGKSGEAWTYKMDLPVTFFSLSAGAYHTFEQKIGKRTFRTWSFRMKPEESRWQGVMYADILNLYSQDFGPYPFGGFGAVDQPNYGDGMLEAYSFNTGQQGSYPAEEPHEPSHTWFGGMINNTYLRSFWNESFANWCEGYYRRNVPLGDPEERRRAFVSQPEINILFNAAPVADAPADIGPAASAIGYGKGSYVLQMLEEEMGTEKMVDAIRRWMKQAGHGTLGEWEDFEKVVGPEYKWFFDQWLYRPGFPVFTVSDVAYRDGAVVGRIKFAGPAYRIHMEALLGFPSGNHLTEVFDTTEKVDGDGYTFHIPCPKKPALVSLDPWLRVLRPILNDERPFSAAMAVGTMKLVRDAKHPEYLSVYKAESLKGPPPTVAGMFLIGHPSTMPVLNDLCRRAGFAVRGNYLTYKGTTVDLRSGGAVAVLDIPAIGRCAIGLGTVHLEPDMGNAQVAVFDQYGRFLTGETAPKTTGSLTFRL